MRSPRGPSTGLPAPPAWGKAGLHKAEFQAAGELLREEPGAQGPACPWLSSCDLRAPRDHPLLRVLTRRREEGRSGAGATRVSGAGQAAEGASAATPRPALAGAD